RTPLDLLSFPTRRSSDLNCDFSDRRSGRKQNSSGGKRFKTAVNNSLLGDLPLAFKNSIGIFCQFSGCYPVNITVPIFRNCTFWRDRKSTRLNSSHVSISY